MSAKKSRFKKPVPKRRDEYSKFDLLDGRHPWQKQVTGGYILYPTRKLEGGKVSWFNFDLAKEMGLLPLNHPDRLSNALEKKILETFSLRIINEFDQQHNIHYLPSTIKRHKYMATRYLQLQHDDKTGKTSGDGRCIWNGCIRHKGKTWDISSRGTGVTALAPGSVKSDEPLESGNTDFGYGCGLAEIDELYGSAMMAEIMHLNGLNTERMLAIVDIGGDCAIGVRAGENLFRPAHLFMYLKQDNYNQLKNATDFLINRQLSNDQWNFNNKSRSRFRKLLHEVCESFAQFAAQLEREYIFTWLDWDGDNVLANAGIIDYGSVRQFGVRHDQYRYDDVERFSTNLNEQRAKAKLTVQVFTQMVDYLMTEEKKPLSEFKTHESMKKFDEYFQYYLLDHFLYQVGLKKAQREQLLQNEYEFIASFYKNFEHLERRKTKRKRQKVADGVNRPAVFNMRLFLCQFPGVFAGLPKNDEYDLYQPEDFAKSFATEFASKNDLKLSVSAKKQILLIQRQYLKCLNKVIGVSWRELTEQVKERAQLINRTDRVTGNALINMVNEIVLRRKKGLSDRQIMNTMNEFVLSQVCDPDRSDYTERKRLHKSLRKDPLGRAFLSLVADYKEDI